MNTFNLGACSTVSHKRVSQLTSDARPYRLLLSGNRQATVDYFCTKPSVCSWRVRSRQASMFLRVPGPWSSISHCSTALQLRARLGRGTAVVKSGEALQPANALAVKCTQMEAVGSSIHQAFHNNIPPQLKTLANLKKSTWGQTPRVLLSCVSGASDREN